MRLHILVEVSVNQDDVGVLRRKLMDFNATLNDNTYSGEHLGFNYVIEFNGDYDVGVLVMDEISHMKRNYLVAYLADSVGITQLLKIE